MFVLFLQKYFRNKVFAMALCDDHVKNVSLSVAAEAAGKKRRS